MPLQSQSLVAIHTPSSLVQCLTIFHVNYCYTPSSGLLASNVLHLQSILLIVAELSSPNTNLIVSLSETKKTSQAYRKEFIILLKIWVLSQSAPNLLACTSEPLHSMCQGQCRPLSTGSSSVLLQFFLVYLIVYFSFLSAWSTATFLNLPNLHV